MAPQTDVAPRTGGGRTIGQPSSGLPPVLVVHPGAELYGADRVLLESVTALSAHFDVTVVVPVTGPLVDELEARGFRVALCTMPVLRNSALRPRGFLLLVRDALRGTVPALRLMRRYGRAGVYVNTVTLPSWPLLARLARRRTLCHVHEAERSRPRLMRRALALAPALSDRVVVNSRFTLEVLTEVAPRLRARSTVVYNGVQGPAEVRPPRAVLDSSLRLLFVGRLSPRKGPQVAVTTLAELVRRGVDARLTLVGSVFEGYEWFETELRESVASLGLTDRVEFQGFQSNIWPALADADVVLVPSISEESFGNTAVEAMLAARPLVVSDSSGLREAAAGYAGAQAVDPGEILLWADAVELVVAHWPAFRRAAMEDAVLARERHAAATYGAGLTGVLSALAGAPGPAEPGPQSG